MTRIATLSIGYGFLLLGFLGLFLPFLQGFLFIFVGLIVLSRQAPWANRALRYVHRRWPRFGGLIAKAEGVAERTIDRTVQGMRRLLGKA
ncbi:PGPGW domain-containing protein [Geminicoccus flavidas]|uniref:PGPGW domain-containing protein n=1 Tax=Geminicoccus flavidas TaxID=2506407 RepID=UPI001356A30D|nr:PGPGW domain-containing protein [Geminicoccus flavidas]